MRIEVHQQSVSFAAFIPSVLRVNPNLSPLPPFIQFLVLSQISAICGQLIAMSDQNLITLHSFWRDLYEQIVVMTVLRMI